MTENSEKKTVLRRQADVLCPVCLDYITWRETPLYERIVREGKWREVSLDRINNPIKRADLRSTCYIKCPNPAQDTSEHYLPVTYRDHGDPIVVGLVGSHKAGKTHLLATMIHEALGGGLDRYGITVEPADEIRHKAFQTGQIERLLSGLELHGTGEGITTFAEMLLVRSRGESRPLVFFDVAGEDFTRNDGGRRARFLLGVTALMFIEDPAQRIPALRANGETKADVDVGNQYFTAALRRIQALPRMRELPATIVLTKSDQLRYQHPVDTWLRREIPAEGVRAEDFLAESSDVYAFLAQYGADSTLGVYDKFAKCTLHFVSATGVAADGGTYPRGIRPARVLQPLVALLAMVGVLD
ncbi:MAG: TRAFAC clade GTPase domain-containing protein, partial [Pseudonocardiaceae bacterium]